MKRVFKGWPFVVALALGGCSHAIHQVHVSDFTPYVGKNKGKIVRAETEQFVIMSFAQQTDYVEQAYRKLAAECPGGRVQGITTQYSTSHGFFSWTNKILMQGLCSR